MTLIIKNEFLRNAVTLVLGTLIAQGLPFFFYPILSRIYSPSQFGELSILLSIVPFVAILASGMYECAIPLVNSKQEVANLVVYIFKRSFKICSVIFALLTIFLIFKHYLNLNFQIPELILLIPFVGFFTIIINIYNEWCVSYKYFNLLSYNKIIATSSISVAKLFFGILKILKFGLILGDVIGKLFASIFAAERIYRTDKLYIEKTNKISYLRLQKRFSKMSFFLLLDQVLNNIGGSIHVVFFALYFNKTEIGYVAMALTILTAPITVIAGSIKDVFRQKANYEYIQTGNCRSIYIKLFFPILFFGFIFFFFLYLFVPDIFNIFLGNKWVITGKYSQILMPMFLTNFISMSLGGVLVIANKSYISMYWQLYNILLSVIGLFIGVFLFESMEETLFCFMIARSLSYITYSIISFYFAKKRN